MEWRQLYSSRAKPFTTALKSSILETLMQSLQEQRISPILFLILLILHRFKRKYLCQRFYVLFFINDVIIVSIFDDCFIHYTSQRFRSYAFRFARVLGCSRNTDVWDYVRLFYFSIHMNKCMHSETVCCGIGWMGGGGHKGGSGEGWNSMRITSNIQISLSINGLWYAFFHAFLYSRNHCRFPRLSLLLMFICQLRRLYS